MLFYAYKILIHEGVLLKVFLAFILFSPILLLDKFLFIPVVILISFKELLNQGAPSESLVRIFRIYYGYEKILICSNILIIVSANLINAFLLVLFSFLSEGNVFDFNSFFKQVGVLNYVL